MGVTRFLDTGIITVGNTLTDVIPWTVAPKNKFSIFSFWAINLSGSPLTVSFQASPDGQSPDVDSDSRTLAPGTSWQIEHSPSIRYAWRLQAVSGGSTQARFGIDVDLADF